MANGRSPAAAASLPAAAGITAGAAASAGAASAGAASAGAAVVAGGAPSFSFLSVIAGAAGEAPSAAGEAAVVAAAVAADLAVAAADRWLRRKWIAAALTGTQGSKLPPIGAVAASMSSSESGIPSSDGPAVPMSCTGPP